MVKCWANLSDDKQKVFETFDQFVNRIVGVGSLDDKTSEEAKSTEEPKVEEKEAVEEAKSTEEPKVEEKEVIEEAKSTEEPKVKMVKSYKELSKEEIKAIKSGKKDYENSLDILLTEDGRKEKDYLEQEEEEIGELNSRRMKQMSGVEMRYTMSEDYVKKGGEKRMVLNTL